MDDLYEIYSDRDIQFTYPNELFMDIFEIYPAIEIDLDSFITLEILLCSCKAKVESYNPDYIAFKPNRKSGSSYVTVEA